MMANMQTTASILSRAERFGSAPRAARPVGTVSAAAAPVGRPAPAVQTKPTESFIGVLERLNIYNDWGVGNAYSEERKSVKVTGKALVDLVEGVEYEFRGHPTEHAVHGEGFDVTAATPYIQPNRKSIVKFLVRNFKGVTEIKAKRFLDSVADAAPNEGEALEALRQQLLTAPWTVDLTGVSKKAEFKNNQEASPVLAFVHRDLATKLGGFPGIKDNVLKLLAAHLLQGVQDSARAGLEDDDEEGAQVVLDPKVIEKCWAALIQDPYEPISSIPGYAFGTADAIGTSVNIPRDAPVRLKALVLYALDQGCTRGGHTFLTASQLVRSIADLDPRVPAEKAIAFGLEADLIQLDEEFGVKRFYTPDLLDAERSLARRIALMCEDDEPLVKATYEQVVNKIHAITRKVAPHLKQGLDESQVKALAGIMTSRKRLHTLTAGPGCGKTALMEILSEVLKTRDFVFCGPTGKNAKVLNSRVSRHGRSASTVHSTLQGGGRKDFEINENNPLEGQILVLDEGGMADNDLADGVMSAAVNMHVIILGDVDQLPSIGPGTFLRDLLALDGPDHHRLNKTHRNSGGILEVIEQVRQGTIDCIDREAVTFSHKLGKACDEFATVARSYIQAVSLHGFEHVMLLIPKRQGDPAVADWNISYANAVLRGMCNPNAEKIPGTSRLHVGDRIIIRANMDVPRAGAETRRGPGYEDDDPKADMVRVVNGDTGSIVSYLQHEQKQSGPRRVGAKTVRLKLDDGRAVDFPGAAVEALDHSYALTVHSAQGSEYKHVIAVVPPASRSFNNRTMLTTGLSRAQARLHVHGEDADIQRVAATLPAPRNSALAPRVRRLMGQPDVVTEVVGDACDDDTDDDGAVPITDATQMSARARRYSMGVGA